MEDSKDKIRRNLLVFSGLILITEYLGVEPIKIFDLLVSDKFTIKHINKIWHVAAVVFLYLNYRFLTLDDTKKNWQAVKEVFITMLKHNLAIYLNRLSDNMFKHKKVPDNIKIDPTFEADIQHVINSVYIESNVQRKQDYGISSFWILFAQNEYVINVNYQDLTTPETYDPNKIKTLLNNRSQLISTHEMKFSVKIAPSWLITIAKIPEATLRTFIKFEFSEIAIPIACSLIAGTVIIFKIVN